MPRALKLITTVLVLLGLFAGTAFADTAPTKSARLDPNYGWHGSYAVATTAPTATIPKTHLALAPNGEAYVLQGRTVLAFSPAGRPDRQFGKNGRIWVNPGPGEVTQVASVAVDPQGHVLVAGTYVPFPGFTNPVVKGAPEYPSHEGATEAFVARYLPDGSPDSAFGTGGVVISSFGLPRPTNRPYGGGQANAEYERPSVSVTQLLVDSQGRPLIAGEYVEAMEWCGYGSIFTQGFVARLTGSGAPDPGFGGTGYAKVPGAVIEGVATGPDNEVATLSSYVNPCAEHGRGPGPYWTTSVLTETGDASPTLDPARPTVGSENDLVVDAQGRILLTEREEINPFESRGAMKVIRLLPNGDFDTSFGHDGGANLKRFNVSNPRIAVDGKSRTVVAFGSSEPELIRITSGGKIDHGFRKKGALLLNIGRAASTEPEAVAIDSKGRIVVAGTARGGVLKTGYGVGIARVLPPR